MDILSFIIGVLAGTFALALTRMLATARVVKFANKNMSLDETIASYRAVVIFNEKTKQYCWFDYDIDKIATVEDEKSSKK